jgi:hypothetical protein
VDAPPVVSRLAETISVKNQCPPLLEPYSQEGSPPLLQARLFRPMMLSREIGADSRLGSLDPAADVVDAAAG